VVSSPARRRLNQKAEHIREKKKKLSKKSYVIYPINEVKRTKKGNFDWAIPRRNTEFEAKASPFLVDLSCKVNLLI
jgi:hypothetical protein